MEYPKINSLWKRKEYAKGMPKGSHGPLIEGEYSQPEFGAIKTWRVDEKVDGTNIRIIYSDGKVSFKGRTDDAMIPPKLLTYLQQTFHEDLLYKNFPPEKEGDPYNKVIIFGEGYGAKIQGCGGNYREDQAFILFDIVINGWWLQRDDVRTIGEKLGIPSVPDLGIMTEDQIIEFVKSKHLSKCSKIPQVIEGIVARSAPLMLFRNGKSPIMWKLKCKEFK